MDVRDWKFSKNRDREQRYTELRIRIWIQNQRWRQCKNIIRHICFLEDGHSWHLTVGAVCPLAVGDCFKFVDKFFFKELAEQHCAVYWFYCLINKLVPCFWECWKGEGACEGGSGRWNVKNIVISQFSLFIILFLQVGSGSCVRFPGIFKGQWQKIKFKTVHEFYSEKLGQVWEGQDSAFFK